MSPDQDEHCCAAINTKAIMKTETIEINCAEQNMAFHSNAQFDNFYNAKLATFEFGKGNFRDSVIQPASPKYYSIKSHIRHFYDPPDEELLDSGEFMQGDDFQFTTEPPARTDWCFYIHLCLGVNLLVLGVVTLAVGLLPNDTEAEVRQKECQLVGTAALLCGLVVVVCSWLRSQSNYSLPPPLPATYYCVSLGSRGQRMPLYGTIGPIQPSFIVSQK